MIRIVFDSQLVTALMKCPASYKYRFIDCLQKKGGKSNSIECGSIAHFILEWYYRAKISGKNRNDCLDIAFAAGMEYLKPYKETNLYMKEIDHPGVVNTQEESTKKPDRIGWRYVVNTMHEYFDFHRNEPNTPLFVEHVKQHLLYKDDEMEILVKAKYDLIEDSANGFLPTDHKTMSQRRDTLSLNNQFMLQCIILKSRQVRVNKIGWQSSLSAEEKFQRVYIPYSVDRLAEFANVTIPHQARMLIAYTQAEHFPFTYNCEGRYGKCDYYEIDESERANRDTIKKLHYVTGKVWDIGNEDDK